MKHVKPINEIPTCTGAIHVKYILHKIYAHTLKVIKCVDSALRDVLIKHVIRDK